MSDRQGCAAAVQIRLGVRYLKDVLKMQFPELRARAAAAEAEARRREVRLLSYLAAESVRPCSKWNSNGIQQN